MTKGRSNKRKPPSIPLNYFLEYTKGQPLMIQNSCASLQRNPSAKPDYLGAEGHGEAKNPQGFVAAQSTTTARVIHRQLSEQTGKNKARTSQLVSARRHVETLD